MLVARLLFPLRPELPISSEAVRWSLSRCDQCFVLCFGEKTAPLPFELFASHISASARLLAHLVALIDGLCLSVSRCEHLFLKVLGRTSREISIGCFILIFSFFGGRSWFFCRSAVRSFPRYIRIICGPFLSNARPFSTSLPAAALRL